MSDAVMTLFEEFAARRARGERPDPVDYLARAGARAADLATLIDRYLQEAPAPEAPAPEDVAVVGALLEGEPALLGLRRGRGVRVDAVAARIVEALGLDEGRATRVKRLYQRLEAGLLDPRRVDRRVLSAVAAALGVAERDVPLGGPRGAREVVVAFARDPASAPSARDVELPPEPPPEEADAEVDRLFGLGAP